MTPLRLFAACLVAAALGATTPSRASVPREVLVASTRIHVGDIAPSAGGPAADVDLGPAPSAGGSRLLTRAEVAAALSAAGIAPPANLPEVVRVLRKTKVLAPGEMDSLVLRSLAPDSFGRGVSLRAVRADRAVDVAEGWARIQVEVPRAPKHAGPFLTNALVSFFGGDDVVIARVTVPVELLVSPEGAAYEVPHGTTLTLIVRRNLVEVHVPAVATADGDVGDTIPVQVRSSGRTFRARVLSRDEALAVEDPR